MSKRQRIGFLTLLLGLILVNYPLVNVINEPFLVIGVPQVFLYVFLVWLLIIGVAYVVSLDQHNSK